MNAKIQSTLTQLSQLDLSTYPYEKTKKLIRQLGRFCYILVTLHQGTTLMRARPNNNGERFFSKYDYTYKPQQLNNTFQRASTPNRTMFYASTIPSKIEHGELNNTRVIGALEALSWLHDKTTKGYQKVSFGRWSVTKDLNLIAIVQHEDFYKKSSYTRELVDSFKRFIKLNPELKDETIAISNFFANEFAKEKIKGDFDYLISATFSETIVDDGFDGILYPSVRVEGKGFNVAIRPEIVDTNLELCVVGECSIYKYYDQIIIDNETGTKLKPNQTHFKLLPVEIRYHAGQEECLRFLGLKSMEELF